MLQVIFKSNIYFYRLVINHLLNKPLDFEEDHMLIPMDYPDSLLQLLLKYCHWDLRHQSNEIIRTFRMSTHLSALTLPAALHASKSVVCLWVLDILLAKHMLHTISFNNPNKVCICVYVCAHILQVFVFQETIGNQD